MFDFFGGGTDSLRRMRKELDASLREPVAQWSYPVVQEKCGCGASTETVFFDDKRAEKFFSEWRKDHGCTLKNQKEPAV